MARELREHQLIERSIIKKFRKSIWNNFIECVKGYSLISQGDTIGITLTDCAEAVLCTKLMQQLEKISEIDFSLKICADKALIPLAERLNIPLSDNLSGCTSIVDFTCLDNVVEAVLRSMLYEHQLSSIPPLGTDGSIQTISPLYCIDRGSIYAFSRYNSLGFEHEAPDSDIDNEVHRLVDELKGRNEGIEASIFKSVHALCLDTMPGFEAAGEHHFFIDEY